MLKINSMNKVILLGRLTKTPESKSTQTGKKVVSFTIAVDDGKNQSGEKQSQFFNCTAWERTADIIQNYTDKGSQILVVGKLQNRSWDKGDGTKGYATDVLVNEIELLGGKKEDKPSTDTTDFEF
jgi:single-strand DNA-binding protein